MPTILTILGTTVVGFINSLIVGSMLDKDSLAAVNIVSSFTFLFSMLGCLISIGASLAASVEIGKDNHENAGKYMTFALLVWSAC